MGDVADWVQSSLNATHRRNPKLGVAPLLNDFHRRAIALLALAMNTGVYNLPVRWDRADWACGGSRGGLKLTLRAGGLATWDFDHLTRLVLLAHQECIRVDLEAAAPGFFRVYLHPRSRDGDMWARHPTIEQAIERLAGVRA